MDLLRKLLAFPGGSVVKNPPADAAVSILGCEDPLEEEMATHSSMLAWEKSHGQRSLAGYSPWSHKESGMTEGWSMHTQGNYQSLCLKSTCSDMGRNTDNTYRLRGQRRKLT